MAEQYATLESLIKDFAQKFTRKGPTDLNDKTTATLFSRELAKRIRQYATVRKRLDKGDTEEEL